MSRHLSVVWSLAVLFGGNACLEAAGNDAHALEEAFQEAIKKAEPSVVCILVSRSDVYQRWFGDPPQHPCKLGGFDPARAVVTIPAGDRAQFEEFTKSLEKRYKGSLSPELVRAEFKKSHDLADPANVPEAYGSGVILHAKGLILTNYHVIRDATKIYVRLPGGKGSYADIHAANQRSDLAVLRLLNPRLAPLPALPLGDGGKARKGQIVLALANPFAAGFKDGSASASWGIISNLRRRASIPAKWEFERAKLPLHHFETLIQTDARLNLGCSGGALINLQGELIGLTTSLAGITGAETAGGYAIPLTANMRAILDVLERGEEVSFGFLGVGFRRDDARGKVQINVIRGSAADRVNLTDEDVIVRINGLPIHENDDLFLAVSTLLAGSRVRLDINRFGQARVENVVLDKLYVPDKVLASTQPQPFRGLRVEYASVLYQRDRPQQGIPRGVYVQEVQAGSAADLAHLHDALITKVNGAAVTSPPEFYRAVEKLSGPVVLTIFGNGGTREVKLD